MTPEDKIVEAIDRLTKAIESYSIDVFFANVARIMLAGAVVAIAGMIGCPPSKATPLLPPLAQPPMFDIGDPPKPPANPHIQHWYTMDVPGPDGVLPVEVFAPRLYSPVVSVGPVDVEVDVPEPGTWLWVSATVIGLCVNVWIRRKVEKLGQRIKSAEERAAKYREALESIDQSLKVMDAGFIEISSSLALLRFYVHGKRWRSK